MTLSRSWRFGLLAAVVAGLVPDSPVAARTWRVEKDGSGDYTTIQPAVNGASPGDTIRLGVGRWTEYAPVNSQGKKWIENVYVHVTADSLTLLGAGADQSIIGPTTVIQPPAEWPKGICSLRGIKRLRVENLTVEHIREGLYFSEGLLQVNNCMFRGGAAAIVSWGERGNVIQQCQFMNNSDSGITGVAGAGGFIVNGCVFSGNPGGVDFYTVSALVTNCTFSGGYVGAQFTMGAIGTVRNCVFEESIENYSIWMNTDAQVRLEDSRIRGGAYNVHISAGATVSGTGNIFGGGRLGTFQIYACVPDLHGNHILHGAGPTVIIESFAPPLQTIDMTGNYWGTSNPDSIAAWIHDGHDDPSIPAYVQFEPFSPTPLPTEKKSLGGVKGPYR
jgi:hypothetical protein